MKAVAFIVCLMSLTNTISAQRGSYAGLQSKLGPELASRFRTDNNTVDSTVLANRVGDPGAANANIPTDARGDGNLVNRLNQWPRENRPFWLINAEHIEKHRHPDDNVNQPQQTTQNTQNAQNTQTVQTAQTSQTAQTGQNLFVSNRNNFDLGDNLEVVNGIVGSFDKHSDGTQNINFASRSGFDDGVSETRPIKPIPPRSSFLGPLN